MNANQFGQTAVSLALDFWIQTGVAGKDGVELAGLNWFKKKGTLQLFKGIDERRLHRLVTASFSLNKVHDELGNFGSPDDDKAARVFDSFSSHSEGDLDNELGNAFEEDDHRGELGQDACPF
jgi:hypothetical protein